MLINLVIIILFMSTTFLTIIFNFHSNFIYFNFFCILIIIYSFMRNRISYANFQFGIFSITYIRLWLSHWLMEIYSNLEIYEIWATTRIFSLISNWSWSWSFSPLINYWLIFKIAIFFIIHFLSIILFFFNPGFFHNYFFISLLFICLVFVQITHSLILFFTQSSPCCC